MTKNTLSGKTAENNGYFHRKGNMITPLILSLFNEYFTIAFKIQTRHIMSTPKKDVTSLSSNEDKLSNLCVMNINKVWLNQYNM